MKDKLDSNPHLEGHSKKPLLKVIREKCLDCCVGHASEVKLCAATDCSLWPYRMGENPFRKHKITDQQKEAATQRLSATKSGLTSSGSSSFKQRNITS